MLYLATDHAGYNLKEVLKKYLTEELGFEVKDMGNLVYDENDDYPDWILPASRAVAEDLKNGIDSKAIILGGSGQGEAMVANRIPGIRATVYYGEPASAKATAGEKDIIKLSKEHNNANILSLGARFLSDDEAKKSVKLWLETEFSEEERHKRRIEKISNF